MLEADMTPTSDIALWHNGTTGLAGWSTHASSGSHGELAVEKRRRGNALRFNFELAGHGAWVIARREVEFELPSHYVVTLRLRGEAAPNELQLKLVEPGGANVWWWRRHGFAPSHESACLVFRRASLHFAWGPRSGGEPTRLGAIELAVAAETGGPGAFFIEELRIEPREPTSDSPSPRVARVSSSAPGHGPEHVLAKNAWPCWQPAAGDAKPWLELDLGALREWGGLALDFAPGGSAPPSRVLASDDGESWTVLAEDLGDLAGDAGGSAENLGGTSERRWLRTGEAESRFARLELPAGAGTGISRIAVVPIELAVSPARFAATAARAAPRGHFPRHLLGEQAFWALVGGDGDSKKGLLGEDGALEVDAESFSLEPFLRLDGRLLTWNDVTTRASLVEGALPIPSVEWQAEKLCLRVTAFANGEPGRSALVARYAIQNTSAATREVRLFLAVRPFQVTPAWQSLNLAGAVAPIVQLERSGARVRVNETHAVIAVSAPDAFGAVRSEDDLVAQLATGNFPEAERVDDPLGFAQAVFAFDLELAPGASETVVVAVPLFDETLSPSDATPSPLAATFSPPAGLTRTAAAAWGAEQLADAVARWRARLAVVPIALPPSAAAFEASLRASLAWILVSREGPRIQPGARAYRRSWIRDGSITSATLAELGFADEARAFLRWYAPHQFADGRVPCAVDRRGVDLTIEHDSHGEFVWGVVEIFRLTGDLAFLRELWPRVHKAIGALERLRAERCGEAHRGTARFGLLPESISHEGYAAQPVHSYWDDFFALRGLGDAAFAARALGEVREAERISALRDALRNDLHASLTMTIAERGIDFVPGSVELADLDPASTAIAFDPCGEDKRLPQAALRNTFEHYWREFEARRLAARPGEKGGLETTSAESYTPYEIRNATALLRLGWKERALALLTWWISEQQPPAWRQWPEVAHRDRRAPRFLGDLPHGWVASSFARALRRLFADERDEDGVLVVAAGVPEAWVREAPGVRVRGLPTHFGPLDLTLFAESETRVTVSLGGDCRPPGGILLASPLARPLREVVISGRSRPAENPRQVHLTELSSNIELRYG